ncbi:hypothetical protein ACWDZ6_16215 [Streptomyces sp. NPDC002926]
MEELRKERDAALVACQRTELDLMALRNVNQRLMVENRTVDCSRPRPDTQLRSSRIWAVGEHTGRECHE